ncbi:MAG: PTS system, mannose-specific IIC component [Candidatus Ozemobacter sibiricus]|uniref:PTS system, mannose-specific IIC component n=1 Tax=Candidatus Ozemobacter sibiricus TaxID=2268124 RepID=A0A367ZST9_9BACT|nr:MAG: PTS system, mannose-specific IIC component [Candidatus Ozemobacter sibiricus]
MGEGLWTAFIVALIGGVVDLDSTATWQFMVSQPIVAAPLTGLFLGLAVNQTAAGLKLGLVVGAILQLVWIEQLPLGMNVPPDAALASVLSVALGFLAGHRYDSYVEREVCSTVALLLSVALGLLGRSLDMFVRRVNTSINHWVERQLEDGKAWAPAFGHTLGGVATFTKAFLFCFFVTWLGVEPLRYFTKSLNFAQNTGFIVIQGLLPAVGFAVLASMCVLSQREFRAFLAGLALFTVLPASIWLALPLALAAGWYFTRTADGAA